MNSKILNTNNRQMPVKTRNSSLTNVLVSYCVAYELRSTHLTAFVRERSDGWKKKQCSFASTKLEYFPTNKFTETMHAVLYRAIVQVVDM